MWILIDEYEPKLSFIIDESDNIKILELYNGIYKCLIDNQYVEKVIILGKQYINEIFANINIMKHDNESIKYAKYFGLDQYEVKRICEFYEIKDIDWKLIQRDSNEVTKVDLVNKYDIMTVLCYIQNIVNSRNK